MKRVATLLGVVLFAFAGTVRAQDLMPATLRITVDPVATIALDHRQCTRSDTFSKSFPNGGDVLIKISEPGYRTEYRTVSLRQGDRHHESFKLKPEPIPVLFRSNTAATVLCNGSELGVTPFYAFFDHARMHRIIFRAEGYQDQVVSLDLSNGRPRVIDRELISDSGTIMVQTIPAGARLLVNGVNRGMTPCTISRIREGKHTLTLSMDGYVKLQHELHVSAGENIPVNLTLERLPSKLMVSTIPSGARVYVDDVYRGESDLTLTDLSEGRHQIRVVAPGYATMTREVQVTAGKQHTEEFELVIVRGRLVVQTAPAVVKVYDGRKLIGTTTPKNAYDFVSEELAMSLAPGAHEITFKADGYAPVTRKVTIDANKTTTIKLRLEFKPDLEVVTSSGIFHGVLTRQNERGELTIELEPGKFRTFLPGEIISRKLLKD